MLYFSIASEAATRRVSILYANLLLICIRFGRTNIYSCLLHFLALVDDQRRDIEPDPGGHTISADLI